MSGSFVFRKGVGTQMMMASHDESSSKSTVAWSRSAPTTSASADERTSPM